MNTIQRLDALKFNPPLPFPLAYGPWAVFGDLHMGDGGPADNFRASAPAFFATVDELLGKGFRIILPGDVEELWQFDEGQIKWKLPTGKPIVRLRGNHDAESLFPEAVLLNGPSGSVFICHGNQGEWINDEGWETGRRLVRDLWTPLEQAGVEDPTERIRQALGLHDEQEDALVHWANCQVGLKSIFAHTHRPAAAKGIRRQYFNAGACIDGRVEWIEVSVAGEMTPRRITG